MNLQKFFPRLYPCVFFIFLCLFTGFVTRAQDFSKDYKPLRDYRPSDSDRETVTDAYKEAIEQIEAEGKENGEIKKLRKEMSRAITGLSDNFVWLDSHSLVMKTDTLTRYLEQLTRRIQAANPLLAGTDYRIFTYRTIIPNACSRAQGVIFINLDLVLRLETEADLAFILCHELAHDAEKHVLNGIRVKMKSFYDPEFQKQLKKALRSSYNTVKTTETVLTQYLARSTEHTRENELRADSLGLVLFVNAGYNPADAPKTIMKMDGFDEPFFKDGIDYTKHFTFPDYPFKEDWLVDESEEDLGSNLDEIREIPDSLKTHPDCDLRAGALSKIIEKESYTAKGASFIGDYGWFRTMAGFETVEYLLMDEEYGYALFIALQMLRDYPENKYLHNAVSLCLFEIYMAQKKHAFSGVVALKNKEFSDTYNEFLTMLHNWSSSETREIANRYYKQHVAKQTGDPFAGYVGTVAASIDKDKTEYDGLILSYERKYKDAYYKELLDKRFNPKPTNNR